MVVLHVGAHVSAREQFNPRLSFNDNNCVVDMDSISHGIWPESQIDSMWPANLGMQKNLASCLSVMPFWI
jgi:hypothetical protein